MKAIGFTTEQIDAALRCVAGILLMGNLEFGKTRSSDTCQVKSKDGNKSFIDFYNYLI
jgi:myosin heavy subunit